MSELMNWLTQLLQSRAWGWTTNYYTHSYDGPYGSYSHHCKTCGADRWSGSFNSCTEK
jgi:hypothetical protein